MPRKKPEKVYPGPLYYNKRWHNTKQHVVGYYRKFRILVLVGSDTLDLFVKELKENIKKGYQNIIVIEGGTGSGKSSAAIWLAKTMDPKWSITDNYIYSLDDLKKKLDKADNGQKVSPISLFDEAVVSLNSRNSSRTEDKDMLILFNTMRSRGWTTILCVPSIFDLNASVRKIHVDYKLRCPDKAPIKNVPKRGFLEFSKAVRKEYKKNTEPYWYLFAAGIYPPLKKEWNEEYQAIKSAKQDELIREFINNETSKEKAQRRRGRPKKEESDDEEGA